CRSAVRVSFYIHSHISVAGVESFVWRLKERVTILGIVTHVTYFSWLEGILFENIHMVVK
ncbi:hypothetical protein OK871_10450, partial [Streptococcus pneumoniae]|nr:hypothetical protein [Streptococcus pneumoniae]